MSHHAFSGARTLILTKKIYALYKFNTSADTIDKYVFELIYNTAGGSCKRRQLQSRMIFILVWPKFLVRVQMMTCDRRKVSLLHLPVFDLDDDSHSQPILRHIFRHFLRGLCYVNSHQLSRSRFIRLPIVSVSSSIIYLVNIQQLRAVIADAVSAIDSWTRRGQRIGHLGRS
jgi:hypothetical protein